MLNLPSTVTIGFIITVLATFLILIYAIQQSNLRRNVSVIVIIGMVLWLLFQLMISLKGFYYTSTHSIPPRFLLLVSPPILLIVLLFISSQGRVFIDSLPLATITFLSIVRIPVEITLYWLCKYKYVPELMTFHGRNFDVISGITAPFIAYLIYRNMLSRQLLLLWNFIALGLLLNIVVNAILSAPLAIQQFAFDQPNVALLYFPFVWLPSFIVPVVLFTHCVSIRRLLFSK